MMAEKFDSNSLIEKVQRSKVQNVARTVQELCIMMLVKL